MEKIEIGKSADSYGSNFNPLFEYLASKGIYRKDIEGSEFYTGGGYGAFCFCRMSGDINYNEILERFEFNKYISINAKEGWIKDNYNAFLIELASSGDNLNKIKINKIAGNDELIGSHLYPILDYLASKGIFPKNGNYPEDKNVFIRSEDGFICPMEGAIDYDELIERFDLSDNKLSIDADLGHVICHQGDITITLTSLVSETKKIQIQSNPSWSDFCPLIDFLISKGLRPKDRLYLKTREIRSSSRDAYSDYVIYGEADFDDLLNRFEFPKSVYIGVERGSIFDYSSGLWIQVSSSDEGYVSAESYITHENETVYLEVDDNGDCILPNE